MYLASWWLDIEEAWSCEEIVKSNVLVSDHSSACVTRLEEIRIVKLNMDTDKM